ERPDAIVNGVPVYDATVPKVRLYGRAITNVLARVYTLSAAIGDAMCGFRLYPLAPAVALDDARGIGARMQFDTDIIVRLVWAGVPVVNLPTPVTYPADGVSHFDLLRDNLRMVGLHLRLAAGFLWRLPLLLARRLAAPLGPRRDAERC
ncbi:MAG TPA: glycosyltransferase family 2 protein, partial [Burkholderiaceae bacterium]|nr:glycosyltransferase family 2 protein [Burkholderiaceae bacterium]